MKNKAEIQPVKHKAISASAGSGKTFQLAHRYIRLMAGGVSPDRICALTFSRKAAGEIFESIVEHLSGAASSDKKAAETSGHTGLPMARDGYLRLLRDFADSLYRLHISTLDSFIVGIAGTFPTELGISPEFSIVDSEGPEAGMVTVEVLGRIFSSPSAGGAGRKEFFEAFRQATFGHEEKGLESSMDKFLENYRTYYRTLPSKSAWGNEKSVWPDGIRWFVKRDALEQAAKTVLEMAGKGAFDGKIAGGIQRIAEFGAAYDETGRWDSSLDKNKVFKELLAAGFAAKGGTVRINYSRKDYDYSGAVADMLVQMMRGLASVEVNRALKQTAGLFSLLELYEQAYDSYMRQSGILTFTDAQNLLTASNIYSGGALLSRKADTDGRLYIDYRLDCMLDHWLIDEFQDTSDLQWAVLRNLADEILQDESGERSFFYVGDVKQAIYSWRGGNPRLFGSILKQYDGAIEVEPLNVSFRSCPPIIDSVNAVFGRISPEVFTGAVVKQWESVWQEHKARDIKHPAGYAALVEPPMKEDGSKPDQEDRFRVVAGIIKQIDPVKRGLSTAILVRSNQAGREVVDYLRRECSDLTIAHEGNAAICDNAVVQLLCSLVKYAYHPGDTMAWRHIQISPLNDYMLKNGLTADRFHTELICDIELNGFQHSIEKWGERLEELARFDDFGRARLADLVAASGEFDATGSRDCDDYLRFIESYEKREVAASHAVRVMTIHQSKGLGFDVVILPELMGEAINKGGQSGLVTWRNEQTSAPELIMQMPRSVISSAEPCLRKQVEKEIEYSCFDALCVLYVAMTRAKRAMYMVTSFPGKSSEAVNNAAFLKIQFCGEMSPEPAATFDIGGESVRCMYETGDRGWFNEGTPGKAAAKERKAAVLTPAFRKKKSQRTKLVRVIPSGTEKNVHSAARLFHAESRDILDFGSAIHELFGLVEWSDGLDAEKLVAGWTPATGVSDIVRRDVVAQFRSALSAKETRAVLSRPAGSVELWRERKFEVVMENRWITGAFDRVTIIRDNKGRALSAEVLDFKSDRIDDPSRTAKAADKYRPQLELYAESLARILGLPLSKISTRILFTRPSIVVDLRDGRHNA